MSNKKSSTATNDDKENALNLYNALVNDSKSVFYATDKITKLLIKKTRIALYQQTLICKIYNRFKDKTFLLEKVPLNTLFVEKNKNIIHTTLYGFNGPFQALQADIAYISFLARSAVDRKFCLLFVDSFTSNNYTYPMSKRNLLAKKELFYNNIKKKSLRKMRLQTDQDLGKELNKKFNVEM